MRSLHAEHGSLAVEPSLRGLPRGEEFLHFIVAHPDDDAPRLILADYLSDHGLEERAELIRIQCRMYRLEAEEREAGAEYGRLERRSEAILARNAAAWKPGRELSECLFHRGLLETYRVENLSHFLEIAPQVFEQTTIQVLRIRTGGAFQRLFALPGLAHLYELDLAGARGGEGDFLALAASPWLARVRDLNLDSCALRIRDFQVLAGSPFLGSLRCLSLRDTQLRNEELVALSRAPWFGGLVRLDLAGHRLTQQGMRLLVSTVSPSLTWLDLGGHPLERLFLEELAQSSRLVGLKTLMLERCLYGPPAAQMLAQAPSLAGLERLGLAGNRLGGKAVNTLLQSPYLTRLTELDLEDNLTHSEVCTVARSSAVSKLTWLNLQRNLIDDNVAVELANSPHLRCLNELFLDHNNITDSGAQVLASSSLDSLRLLSLESNQIGDDGALTLLHSPLAARSTEVRLFRNPICRNVSRLLQERMTIRPED